MIDYNLNPQEAIDAPRVDCSSDFTDLTSGIDQKTINELIQKGHKINKLSDNDTVIIDEVTFTSRNRYKDFILHVLFLASFIVRSIQYKIFFFGR